MYKGEQQMINLRLNGKTYDLAVGSIFVIDDPQNICGDWVRITTTDYEVTAARVLNDAHNTFIVEKIKVLNEDLPQITEEVIEEKPKKVNLYKLKKPEILNIAAELGFDICIERTKKEWVEMIESLSECK